MLSGTVIWLAWPLVAAGAGFWQVRQRRGRYHVLGVLALVTYVWWICSVAFFPLPTGEAAAAERAVWGGESLANLVPFRESIRTMSHLSMWPLVRQLGGNLLLFVPLTLLGPILWPRFRKWQWVFAAGLVGSTTIEFIQFIISVSLGYPYRQTDVDDVIINTAGALLGFAGFAFFRPLFTKRPSRKGQASGS